MHFILLAVGLIVSVAGLALIALGGPISASELGNTLILAGTIAIVGTLILIGLASAIRQLRRIAQALEGRAPPRAADTEANDATVRATSFPRAPAVTVEPRLESAPQPAAPSIEPMPEPAPEPPALTEAAPPSAVEPTVQEAEAASPPAAPEPTIAAPSAVPSAPPASDKLFDKVWSGEPVATQRESAAASAAVIETVRVEHHATPPSPPEEEPVRIFKSGVIDGMAYTLYTDGSIEAELAQGTVKFASIDELRAYLAARES